MLLPQEPFFPTGRCQVIGCDGLSVHLDHNNEFELCSKHIHLFNSITGSSLTAGIVGSDPDLFPPVSLPDILALNR